MKSRVMGSQSGISPTILARDSVRHRVSLRNPASALIARSQVISKVLPSGVAAPYPITKTRLFFGAFIDPSCETRYMNCIRQNQRNF